MSREVQWDLVGKRFGRLVAIEPVDSDAHGNTFWRCKCDCGNETLVMRHHLLSGDTQSCGCYKEQVQHRFDDLTGQVFGRLTVLEYDHTENGRTFWKCQCSCGNVKVIRRAALTQGTTVSCGCYCKERVKESTTTHGYSNTRLYTIWQGIKNRCTKPTDHNWKYYGGRGITICDEWKDDFVPFYEWAISAGYTDRTTIDRIDNNKGYSPDNCRWTTPVVQGSNKRNNHRVTYQGETKTVMEWVRTLGISKTTLLRRLQQHNGDMEAALVEPYRVHESKIGQVQRGPIEKVKGMYGGKDRHGMCGTKLYRIWNGLKDHCVHEKSTSFPKFGGVGIKLCEDWMGFEGFLAWAQSVGYIEGQTLCRSDVDGNFEPDNCFFGDKSDRYHSMRTCHYLEYKGQRHNINDWARIFGVPKSTLQGRLKRANYDTAIAFAGLEMKGEE